MHQHRLLKIAEYVSLASSALGTVAAVATQQVVYSAAPLTVTLGLNIVNRQKLNSSTQEYLKQKADIQQIQKIKEELNSKDSITDLKSSIVDIQSQFKYQSYQKFQESLVAIADINRIIESLATRQQVNQISKKIDEIEQDRENLFVRIQNNFPKYSDLEKIHSQIKSIVNDLASKEVVEKAEFELANLTNQQALEEAKFQLHDLIARQQSDLEPLLQRFNRHQDLKELENLTQLQARTQTQIDEIHQKLEELLSSRDSILLTQQISELKQQLTQLEKQHSHISNHYGNRLVPAVKQQKIQLQSLVERIELVSQVSQVQGQQIVELGTFPELVTQLQSQLQSLVERIELVSQVSQVQRQQIVELGAFPELVTQLQSQLIDYAKQEKLDKGLNQIRQEILSEIDISIDRQLAMINHSFKTFVSCEYELVYDRPESRKLFVEALDTKNERLILVCPWLSNSSFTEDIRDKMETFIDQGGCIDIGWGSWDDIKTIPPYKLYKGHETRKYLKEALKGNKDKWKYEALVFLEKLEEKYSGSGKINFKLLGTHEKYLICGCNFPSAWAMIGSHNFLTSKDDNPNQRELGLKTSDFNIIRQLVYRFDNAINLEAEFVLATHSSHERR